LLLVSLDVDRRRLDDYLRLIVVGRGIVAAVVAAPSPPRASPAAPGPDDDHAAAVETAMETTVEAASATPGEGGSGRNQQDENREECDRNCLFHRLPHNLQGRPATRGCQSQRYQRVSGNRPDVTYPSAIALEGEGDRQR